MGSTSVWTTDGDSIGSFFSGDPMSLRSAGDFFARLIYSLAADLRKIAGGSSGEVTVEELQAETWIAAAELSDGEGAAPEPTDDDFRGKILSRLWKKFGRFTDRPLKFAYRLDDDYEGEDGVRENSVSASLQAPSSFEPEEALIARQEALENDEETRLAERFAEAVAYVRVSDSFDRDWPAIASHLAIAESTLFKRIRRAKRTVEVQSSMFDGIEHVPQDFMPPQRRRARPLPPSRSMWAAVLTAFRRRHAKLFPRAPIPIRKVDR